MPIRHRINRRTNVQLTPSQKIRRQGVLRRATLLPVIDQERLIGIVTLQNFMHSIGALVESKKLRRDELE